MIPSPAREWIARIIDSDAWDDAPVTAEWEWSEGEQERLQSEAYAKADSIIALLQSDEAVERAAKELHRRVYPEEPWEDCPGMWEDHRRAVRAALASILEACLSGFHP